MITFAILASAALCAAFWLIAHAEEALASPITLAILVGFLALGLYARFC